MRKTRNVKLNLLSLESRLTPTIASFHSHGFTATNNNGTLSIVGDRVAPPLLNSTTLLVSYHGATTDVYAYSPYDSSAEFLAGEALANHIATFSTVNNINVQTNPNANRSFVVLTLDDGQFLAGSVSVDGSQKGNNDVQIQTRTNGPAEIGGNVYLRSGNGANNTFMFDTRVDGTTTVTNLPNKFSRTVIDPMTLLPYQAYGDVFQFSDCNFFSKVTVTNATVLMDSNYGTNTINGNLLINNSANTPLGNFQNISGIVYPVGSTPGSPGTYSSLFVIDAGSQINGNFNYVGSPGNNGAYINGEVTIAGNVVVTLRDGANDFFLGDRGGSATIGGSVIYTGLRGVDHVSIADGTDIGGKVKLDMGDGNNTYDLAHNFNVNNFGKNFGTSFTLVAGKGNDNVGQLGKNYAATIAGDVNVNLGFGDNEVEFGFVGDPAKTNITYVGDSGRTPPLIGTNIDDVFLTGNYRSFNGHFGAGDDTFTYQPGSTLSYGFFGEFDGATTTNIYDRSNVTPTWKEIVRNTVVVG